MTLRWNKALLLALTCSMLFATACGMLGGPGSSPTASFKALYEATKKKDVPAMKKRFSKGTLQMMEGFAKMQNKSLDDMLSADSMDDPATKSATMPETRNEKIEGDNATLEVKDEKSGKWITIPFVKEEGEWKFAFDKMVGDAFKNMNSESTEGNSNK